MTGWPKSQVDHSGHGAGQDPEDGVRRSACIVFPSRTESDPAHHPLPIARSGEGQKPPFIYPVHMHFCARTEQRVVENKQVVSVRCGAASYNPSTQEVRAEDQKFKAVLG